MGRPGRGWAYAAISVLFVSVMMATTEPTPLYAFWQRSYGFGPITTTLVFATYAVGVIAALLFAGRDSDVDGRGPVLIACAGLSALSSVLFLLANGLALLFAARLISAVRSPSRPHSPRAFPSRCTSACWPFRSFSGWASPTGTGRPGRCR